MTYYNSATIKRLLNNDPKISAISYIFLNRVRNDLDSLCAALEKNTIIKRIAFYCSSTDREINIQFITSVLKIPQLEAVIIDDANAEELAYLNWGLAKHPKIKIYEFYNCELNDELADSLKACTINPSMKAISFYLRGPLGTYFFESLGLGIQQNPLFQSLFIQGALASSILERGVILPLLENIKRHPTIRKLYLQGLSIDDRGAIAIADLVKQSKKINLLNIEFNQIAHEGIATLIQALSTNKNLQKLYLRKNEISVDNMLMLKQVAEAHPKLKVIHPSVLHKIKIELNKLGVLFSREKYS